MLVSLREKTELTRLRLAPAKFETIYMRKMWLASHFGLLKTRLENYFQYKISSTCVSCRYEYHWADGTNIKKPIKCSAPKYIDYLMTWVQDQLDDETLFPSKIGMPHLRFLSSPVKAVCRVWGFYVFVWFLLVISYKEKQLSYTCRMTNDQMSTESFFTQQL